MKRSTLPRVGAAALILIGSASCNPDSNQKAGALSPHLFTEVSPGLFVPTRAVLNRILAVAPLKERIIPPCNKPPTVSRVVKLRLGHGGLKIKQLERRIRGKKYSGGDGRDVPEPSVVIGESTPFDMLLDSTAYGDGDDYLAIKIFLKDRDVKFANYGYSVTTVYRTSESEQSIFYCLVEAQPGEDVGDNDTEANPGGRRDKYDYVTVYIDRKIRDTQKFNIRLVVPQGTAGHVMPVILDPNIKNYG